MRSRQTPPRLQTHTYHNRTPAFSNQEVAKVAQAVIRDYRDKGYYWLPTYCIMPDHIHLLIIPVSPDRHVSRIVATLKNAINLALRRLGKRGRRQWGYYDRILRDSERIHKVAEYILMNPVRKGLVDDYRHWPLAYYIGRHQDSEKSQTAW
jgi:putative transposase